MTSSFRDWLWEIGLIESALTELQVRKLREKFAQGIEAEVAEAILEMEEVRSCR